MPDDTSQHVEKINSERNKMLEALFTAQSIILAEIAATTSAGPYLSRLVDRRNAITMERNQVIDAADAAVLNLPTVQAALSNLEKLTKEATAEANVMKTTTDKITRATNLLNIAHKFTDLITTRLE
ncbi:hypothetical protein GE253_23485 [Niveispirillum sp. SYP-B3756]|uniref:hypothetical protein n=1 Tax=Niveispirillum sp. SYP-B3756 TaxID=2662178 RepID=UPI0012919C4E|nr:hypothetical protein [Niveispirillum sp. SYP-B3756]MQP68286.1 hypothetical protein [Niveispirillum sp. SYP-B3756]